MWNIEARPSNPHSFFKCIEFIIATISFPATIVNVNAFCHINNVLILKKTRLAHIEVLASVHNSILFDLEVSQHLVE